MRIYVHAWMPIASTMLQVVFARRSKPATETADSFADQVCLGGRCESQILMVASPLLIVRLWLTLILDSEIQHTLLRHVFVSGASFQ